MFIQILERIGTQTITNLVIALTNTMRLYHRSRKVSFSVSDWKSMVLSSFGLDKILECISLGLEPQSLICIPAIGNAHLHLKRVYQCRRLVSCCQQCVTDHMVQSEIDLHRRRRLHVTKSQLCRANSWQVPPLTAHSWQTG